VINLEDNNAVLHSNARERGTLRPVGEILESAIPHRLALHLKIGEMKKRWGEITDSVLASRSFPVMFEYEPDGIYLLVSASSPAAAQRVKMFSGEIAGKLRELWQIEITGVRVKVI